MYKNIRYRATGGVDYVFSFEWVTSANSWRAYIVSQPGYGNRPTGAHDTHRLSDGRTYVCWDRPLPTAVDARNVAAAWAEATQRYIATGRFELPANRPSIKDRTRVGTSRPSTPPPSRRATGWRRLFS